MGCVDGLQNNAVPTRNLPVETLVPFALQWLYEAAERVVGKLPNIIQDPVPTIRGDRLKLSYGVAVNVYEPGHTLAGPA